VTGASAPKAATPTAATPTAGARNKAAQNKAARNKAAQNKAAQNKAAQNKAAQNKAAQGTALKKPAGKADFGRGTAGLDRFVAAVRQKLPDVLLDRRDEEVEDLGRQACRALRNGRSATAAAGVVAAQGVTPADARTLVGLARGLLCRG
jgi:hypothetical protein